MDTKRKKRVLFVDDESMVLFGLKRLLHGLRDEWEADFAGSGEEALVKLSRDRFDVVVSDMRMPGMDGAELLRQVMDSHPQVVRIILSGQADREAAMRSIRHAHQFLPKPCDAKTLKETLARVSSVGGLAERQGLQRVLARMDTIPSLPTLYTELMTELQASDSSFQNVGRIIARDVGMTAKILQMVNSAFFGLSMRVTSPVQAVSLLGLDTVRALVLSARVFSLVDASSLKSYSLERLTEHSLNTGLMARTIARLEKQPGEVVSDAFLAGILHDCGRFLLLANLPEECEQALAEARAGGLPIWEAEARIIGLTHAEVGGYLLGIWGLPGPIVEAVTRHHIQAPWPSAGFSILGVLRVANALEHDLKDQPQEPDHTEALDCLQLCGVEERLPVWREACEEILARGGSDEA